MPMSMAERLKVSHIRKSPKKEPSEGAAQDNRFMFTQQLIYCNTFMCSCKHYKLHYKFCLPENPMLVSCELRLDTFLNRKVNIFNSVFANKSDINSFAELST